MFTFPSPALCLEAPGLGEGGNQKVSVFFCANSNPTSPLWPLFPASRPLPEAPIDEGRDRQVQLILQNSGPYQARS